MKVETKDSVNAKIKDIRQRLSKDKSEKVADGKKRSSSKAGHQDHTVEEGEEVLNSKAGGGAPKQVQFWEPPEEFQVDYTKEEHELQDLVKGPDLGWVENVFRPHRTHGGRDGECPCRSTTFSAGSEALGIPSSAQDGGKRQ